MTASVGAGLDDRAAIHDGDLVADMLDHAEVVGDEDRGDPEVALQVHEQIEDLRLNAHVERADRLVGDDQFRLAGKRRGDADALALPARKMRRQAAGQRRVESDAGKEVEHAAVAVGRRADAEAVERLAHAAADRPARIEAAVGVLEHRLHAAAEVGERACRASAATSVPSKVMAPLSGSAGRGCSGRACACRCRYSPTSPSVRAALDASDTPSSAATRCRLQSAPPAA